MFYTIQIILNCLTNGVVYGRKSTPTEVKTGIVMTFADTLRIDTATTRV